MKPSDSETTEFCCFMAESYREFFGTPLISAPEQDLVQFLYNADFVLVAHHAQKDPIFCFANLEAQKLWEMDWEEFTKTPSRQSAPENARAERQALLDAASAKNIITDYSGLRMSKTGKLFMIQNVILWNIFNQHNKLIGQAAKFSPGLVEYVT